MKIGMIVKRVNQLLAGETLSYSELVPHLDTTMDLINTELSAKFPVFSELTDVTPETDFTLLPDKYIRSVLCLGTAINFYITDEEGSTGPQAYAMLFEQALYNMKRDWLQFVPEEYVDDPTASAIPRDINIETPLFTESFML
jgi:hypothetical protein